MAVLNFEDSVISIHLLDSTYIQTCCGEEAKYNFLCTAVTSTANAETFSMHWNRYYYLELEKLFKALRIEGIYLQQRLI